MTPPPFLPPGIIPPLVTPLRAGDELDADGLERVVEHVLGGGVHGLFILGTTGEGPHLSYRLRREVIERTCAQVGGRVPVLVGISDTSLVEALQVAAWSAEAGAAAVVAAPPYYVPASQAELQHYFSQLASAAPLPLVLYNMPAMTKVVIEPETVRQAMEHPRIVGLKDSSGNLNYLHQVLRLREQRSDWRIYVGEEETLAYAVQAGGDGGVNGGAILFPRLLVQLFEAAVASDRARIAKLQRLLIRLGEIYRVGRRHSGSGIKAIKAGLAVLGICGDQVAAPLQPFAEAERARVRQIVEGLAEEGLRT